MKVYEIPLSDYRKPLPKIWTSMATTSRRISRSFTTACLLSGILHMHLLEIDQTARKRLELMMPEMAKAAGATKELKTYAQINFVKGVLEKGKARRHQHKMCPCAFRNYSLFTICHP